MTATPPDGSGAATPPDRSAALLDRTAVLLDGIAGIGRDPDTGGYRRFAFTAEDAALAEWFTAACTERGLAVSTDGCGNQWAWWGDPEAAADAGTPGVVTGSHLDSVPDGGAFDGPLGVAAALAAVDLLRAGAATAAAGAGGAATEAGGAGVAGAAAAEVRPGRPLGIVRFVDEEGARFGLACSGSRLLTGAADPERVLGLRDAAGITYAQAMASAGLDPAAAGRDPRLLRRVGAFVELHLEQGRGLVDIGAAVGVATMIRPHGRWRIDLAGRADHAGTTLLADRDDALLALARLVPAVRRAADRHGGLATVGKVDVHPNAVNAVPSRVSAWLDVRADTPEQVRAVLADLAGLGFAAVEESWTAATAFDPALTARVARAAADTPDPAPGLPTGAGHDAGILARAGIPAAMLFVRNPTGVSHAPAEHAEPADVRAGTRALARVLSDLCAIPGWQDRPS